MSYMFLSLIYFFFNNAYFFLNTRWNETQLRNPTTYCIRNCLSKTPYVALHSTVCLPMYFTCRSFDLFHWAQGMCKKLCVQVLYFKSYLDH